MDQMHYWRRMFGEVYILLGLFGFLLSTHTPPEIIVRTIFIVLGIMLWFMGRQKCIYLLITGAALTVGWVFFAIGMIINNWENPAYRYHVASLPLWFLFLRMHYRAIRGLSIGE